jgi:hypothetical protein
VVPSPVGPEQQVPETGVGATEDVALAGITYFAGKDEKGGIGSSKTRRRESKEGG